MLGKHLKNQQDKIKYPSLYPFESVNIGFSYFIAIERLIVVLYEVLGNVMQF